MPIQLDAEFWENRYQQEQTGWDIGHISTPLKTYIDQLQDKQITILIPGCGNAYEARYLWQQGFHNTHILDWSASALQNFKAQQSDFPDKQLLQEDFFKHQGQYDLILEQTFFCALSPTLRPAYVQQMHRLLKPKGKLVGLLFNILLHTEHPPFGGNIEEYRPLFATHFDIQIMEPCYNSIKPRQGSELFIKLTKLL